MSSLSRYKKSGGFFQLLSLIETFGPQKREKFLEMIDAESPAWAGALREKMLSLERIFSWNEDTVVGIFKRLTTKGQAYALMGLKEEYKAKIEPFISGSDKRRMDDVLSENHPKPEEVQATLLKIVEITRQLLKDRELNPERFDQELSIPEDIEIRLENSPGGRAQNSGSSHVHAVHSVPASVQQAAHAAIAQDAPNAGAGSTSTNAEVYQLQRGLGLVLKENKNLKDEVRMLRDKLEQIRKIA